MSDIFFLLRHAQTLVVVVLLLLIICRLSKVYIGGEAAVHGSLKKTDFTLLIHKLLLSFA